MTVEYECDDFNEFTCFFRWRGTVLCAALPKQDTQMPSSTIHAPASRRVESGGARSGAWGVGVAPF